MIPLVAKREPFIQLVTNTLIQQGKYIYQFLNSITNSSAVRQTTSAVEVRNNYSVAPQSGFLPAGVCEEAYMSSLFFGMFVLYSLYEYTTRLPFFSADNDINEVIDDDWLNKMPDRVREKLEKLRQLAALNSQLSIHHVFAGMKPSMDEKVVEEQLDNIMSRMNDELFEYFDTHPMPYNELFINNAFQLFEAEPGRMISSNATFIQLIVLANKSGDKALEARAHQLYETYLRSEDITRYTKVARFGSSKTRKVDWKDIHANNYIMLPASNLIIAILISHDKLERMLADNPEKPTKDSFYVYNASGSALIFDDYPLQEFYKKHYPLFEESLERPRRERKFAKLLKVIIPWDEQIRDLFFSARGHIISQTKLTGDQYARRLREIFTIWLRFSMDSETFRLEEKHCNDILTVYGVSGESPREQAKVLLSLATFFIKSASSQIFGTEEESPEAIRLYAYALMHKAYSLDSSIFRGSISDWSDILLEAGELPQNSEMLARVMSECNKLDFPEVLEKIMPPSWH